MIVKNRAEEIVAGIQAEEAVANEKLAAAEPALRAAEEALNTIKAADIATVRKLAKPPHLIMRIMDCILLLFQENIQTVTQDPERESPTPSWADALKLMSQSTFLSNLLNFNKVKTYVIDCLPNTMTPILTKNSLKMNYTPSVRENAHETLPQCVETHTNDHALRGYGSLSENFWSEWV